MLCEVWVAAGAGGGQLGEGGVGSRDVDQRRRDIVVLSVGILEGHDGREACAEALRGLQYRAEAIQWRWVARGGEGICAHREGVGEGEGASAAGLSSVDSGRHGTHGEGHVGVIGVGEKHRGGRIHSAVGPDEGEGRRRTERTAGEGEGCVAVGKRRVGTDARQCKLDGRGLDGEAGGHCEQGLGIRGHIVRLRGATGDDDAGRR